MHNHPAILDLSRSLIENPDRYEAHDKARPIINQLCQDRDFLHDALRGQLENPALLHNATELMIPLLYNGDIIISLNIFCPIKDMAKDITHDNIHHHGWRLLTTGVVSGDGYETINFVRGSHKNQTDDGVNLEVEEIFRHVAGNVRFVDSFQAHVVFHTDSVCCTLAVWSADRKIFTQKIKRHFKDFPNFRRLAVKAAHKIRLNSVLNLNDRKGTYFHPEGGKIQETKNYHKNFDGYRREVLRCWFKFFEQVGFNNADYWVGQKKEAPAETFSLINKLISNEPISDIGITGHPRRRFSKSQILESLGHPAQ